MTREEREKVHRILSNGLANASSEHEWRMAFEMAIKALEQDEPYDFARWVAEEIFDDNWEYNKDGFAELACRKLAKLGIVRAKGDEWELVESEE